MKTYIRIKPGNEPGPMPGAQLVLDYSADLKPGDKVAIIKPDASLQVLYTQPPEKVREVIKHG